jgi:hypothetical protein
MLTFEMPKSLTPEFREKWNPYQKEWHRNYRAFLRKMGLTSRKSPPKIVLEGYELPKKSSQCPICTMLLDSQYHVDCPFLGKKKETICLDCIAMKCHEFTVCTCKCHY